MSLTMVIGPRGCGKSGWYERAILPAEGPIYFGTLLASYGPGIIARHRARRGASWRLIETSGDLAQDARTLEATVAVAPDSPLLIDGLTTWAISVSRQDASLVRASHRIIDLLVQLHRVSQDTPITAIDTLPTDFSDPLDRTVCRMIHRGIAAQVQVDVWDFWRRLDRRRLS